MDKWVQVISTKDKLWVVISLPVNLLEVRRERPHTNRAVPHGTTIECENIVIVFIVSRKLFTINSLTIKDLVKIINYYYSLISFNYIANLSNFYVRIPDI